MISPGKDLFESIDSQRVAVQIYRKGKRLIYTNLGLNDMLFAELKSRTEVVHKITLKRNLIIPRVCACCFTETP